MNETYIEPFGGEPLPESAIVTKMRKNSVITVDNGVVTETPIIKSVSNPNTPTQTYVHPFAKSGMPEREHRHVQTMSELRAIKKAYDVKPSPETSYNGSLDRPSLAPITKSVLGEVSNEPIRKGMDPKDAVRRDWAEFETFKQIRGQYL